MKVDEIFTNMEKEGLDCILIVDPVNITYLTGFRPSSRSVLIIKDEITLYTSRMDLGEAYQNSRIPVEELKSDETIINRLKGDIGIESTMNVAMYKKINGKRNLKIINIIEQLRMVKTSKEIENIKNALKIAEKAAEKVFVELEMSENTENELAAEIEYNMRTMGSSKAAFDTIVASGVRSSFPHALCSNHAVEYPLILDWGATFNYYHSDTSRTIINDEKQASIRDIVLEAQKEAVKVIKPGIKACEVDNVAREVIADYGFAKEFIHSTGHGVGLEVHEKPSLSVKDNTKLEEGMIITIEPGIYIDGNFGVRIEDMVLVKKKGYVLNNIRKDLWY